MEELGLGLTISKKMISILGGSLTLKSDWKVAF
jgi:C4-dicarboxylate-specific signal transduction histidine kinase